MTATWQTTVRPLVTDLLRAHALPGMIVGRALGDRPPDFLVMGGDAAGRPLTEASLFPVASVTKLSTALAIHRLADTGLLTVEDPVGRHLPEAAVAASDIRLRHLLTHTSGLVGDYPSGDVPWALGLTWPDVARALLAVRPELPLGAQLHYSNRNYGLLGVVIERVTGRPFQAMLRDLVLTPLGIEGSIGAEPPRPPALIADVGGPHGGTPLEPQNSPFWRGLGLPGSSLVTTPAGALALVRAFAGVPPGFLRPATRAAATRNQVGEVTGTIGTAVVEPSPWGLGPTMRGAGTYWAPASASPDSFGHSGATGCLVWADPAADVAWAFFAARSGASGWGQAVRSAIGAAILASPH